MILHFVDHAFCPALAKRVAQLQFDDSLRDRADGKKHGAHPEQDQKRIEYPARPAQWVELGIPHRGDGHQRHVESVERRVAFDYLEAHRAYQDSEQQDSADEDDAARNSAIHVRNQYRGADALAVPAVNWY